MINGTIDSVINTYAHRLSKKRYRGGLRWRWFCLACVRLCVCVHVCVRAKLLTHPLYVPLILSTKQSPINRRIHMQHTVITLHKYNKKYKNVKSAQKLFPQPLFILIAASLDLIRAQYRGCVNSDSVNGHEWLQKQTSQRGKIPTDVCHC